MAIISKNGNFIIQKILWKKIQENNCNVDQAHAIQAHAYNCMQARVIFMK